jgi:hypothetical protein
MIVLDSTSGKRRLHLHATRVMKDPAVAPAAPKHARVEKLGYVPRVLTWTRGSTPKFRLNHAE